VSTRPNSRYRVVPTATFQEDIERLDEHIVRRELAGNTPDVTCLFRFRDAVEQAMTILSFAPHTCRRSDEDRQLRELIIPSGHGGCVALFAIRDFDLALLAARDRHERDYRQTGAPPEASTHRAPCARSHTPSTVREH
jgi:hypothetical protein